MSRSRSRIADFALGAIAATCFTASNAAAQTRFHVTSTANGRVLE